MTKDKRKEEKSGRKYFALGKTKFLYILKRSIFLRAEFSTDLTKVLQF